MAGYFSHQISYFTQSYLHNDAKLHTYTLVIIIIDYLGINKAYQLSWYKDSDLGQNLIETNNMI